MEEAGRPADTSGRRVAAFAIDTACVNVGWLVAAFLASMRSPDSLTLLWLGFAVVLMGAVPGITGWSIGKRMLGLRIVDRDSYENPGLGRNIVRCLCLAVDLFPYVPPLAGLVLFLFDDDSRRLGDRLAKTLVIDQAYYGAKPVPDQAAVYGNPGDPAALPAGDADFGGQSSGDGDFAGLSAGDVGDLGGRPVEQPGALDPPSLQPGVDSPLWDPARGAYIQRIRVPEEWFEWDDDAKTWAPISRG